MNFSFTQEQKQFRREVQEFLEFELKGELFKGKSSNSMEESSPEFSRNLAAKGWLGLTWPRENGGANRSYVDRCILMEELLRYQLPLMYHFFGERQIGPGLIHAGSDELKEEFLPKILGADISFCLGISEPDAGSDVAAITTTAKEDEDCFVINGQKIWTTNAHNADYIWLLAVTDPEGSKYKNMSEVIVDMSMQGVTVSPLFNMIGTHCFNEVFFDNVRVPKKYLVGVKNRGFYQILSQVDYERAGLERLMQNYSLFKGIRRYVKTNAEMLADAVVKDKMAEIEIEFEVGRLLCYHVAWVIDQGKVPTSEAAISKHFCTLFEQKVASVATELLGAFGHVMPGNADTPLGGEVANSYLWSPCYTIQGGTSEILKTVIAKRGLRLTFD